MGSDQELRLLGCGHVLLNDVCPDPDQGGTPPAGKAAAEAVCTPQAAD